MSSKQEKEEMTGVDQNLGMDPKDMSALLTVVTKANEHAMVRSGLADREPGVQVAELMGKIKK